MNVTEKKKIKTLLNRWAPHTRILETAELIFQIGRIHDWDNETYITEEKKENTEGTLPKGGGNPRGLTPWTIFKVMAGREIESEAVFSAVDSVPVFDLLVLVSWW